MHVVFSQSPLFEGMHDAVRQHWFDSAEQVELGAGDTLFHEGDRADDFYLLASGTLEILQAGDAHTLATLKAGHVFGAMAAIDGEPRSATVRAREPAFVYRFPRAYLEDTDRPGQAAIFRNLLRLQSLDVREGNVRQLDLFRATIREQRARLQLGNFTAHSIALMCVYGLSIRLGMSVSERVGDTTPFTVACLFVFATALLWMIRQADEPLSTYGLTLNNAKDATLAALLWSVPMLLVTLAIKFILLRTVPAFEGAPLMAMSLWSPNRPDNELLWFAFYVVCVPAQEFVARGALQGSMERFLTGDNASWKANLLANLMFAGSHAHLNPLFALAVIPPGIVWGVLRTRYQTLLGPIVSHTLVGVWIFYIMGVPNL